MVIIEEMSRARERGATIYAEISGYSSSSSAHHLYRPSPTGNGISVALKKGLSDAKTDPSTIDYINADGIGTTNHFYRYEDMKSLKVEAVKSGEGTDTLSIVLGIIGVAALVALVANADSVAVCSPSPCQHPDSR